MHTECVWRDRWGLAGAVSTSLRGPAAASGDPAPVPSSPGLLATHAPRHDPAASTARGAGNLHVPAFPNGLSASNLPALVWHVVAPVGNRVRLSWPRGLLALGSSVHGVFQDTGWAAFPTPLAHSRYPLMCGINQLASEEPDHGKRSNG